MFIDTDGWSSRIVESTLLAHTFEREAANALLAFAIRIGVSLVISFRMSVDTSKPG